MFKLMKKRFKNEKGLTLVEVLAVIVILAIVAAIAIPAIGNLIDNSRYNAVKSDAINVLSAANIYFTDVPDATFVTTGTLLKEGYLESAGKIPAPADPTTYTTPTTKPDVSSTETIITKANPISLATDAITFTGSKSFKFTGATVDGINGDTQKGSGTITDITK